MTIAPRGTDPVFVNERHGLPFVDYLGLAVRWAASRGSSGTRTKTEVRDFVAEMVNDMEPF